MTQPLIHATETVRSLDPAESQRLLERAATARASMRWQCANAADSPVYTAIVLGSEGAWLIVTVMQDELWALDVSTPLQASIDLSGSTYTFETCFAGRCPDSDPNTIRLRKPQSLSMIERRRSPRRRFRKQDAITLRPLGPAGAKGYRATLLNLSPDGVACLATDEFAAQLAIGQVMATGFSVGPKRTRFELAGRIVNVTRAGSSGHTVVGMEFVKDDTLRSLQQCLQDALEAPV